MEGAAAGRIWATVDWRFMQEDKHKTVDFGFKDIPEEKKTEQVKAVFDSVAKNYDVLNDVLSFGMHRLWKRYTIAKAGVRAGMEVLDIASGTGDLSLSFAKKVGASGRVYATDINASMLAIAKRRFEGRNLPITALLCDAEALPFPEGSFDLVSVSFGLRNMTHKDRALKEMLRVLKPGGKLLVLEFSKVHPALAPFYDFYSLRLMPLIGKALSGDEESYRYLPESIRRHPNQEKLAQIMTGVGFSSVTWHNLTFGVCALHIGSKQ